MNKKEIKLIYFGLIWLTIMQLLLLYNQVLVSRAIKGLNHNAHNHILLSTDLVKDKNTNMFVGIRRWYTTPPWRMGMIVAKEVKNEK